MRRPNRFIGLASLTIGLTIASVTPAQSASGETTARTPKAWRVAYWAPRGASLSSVTSPGRRDAWAVGSVTNARRQQRPLVLHWNGRRWSRHSVPGMGPNRLPVYVTATSPSNVWIFTFPSSGIGSEADFRWNGRRWVELAGPPSSVSFVGNVPNWLVLGRSDVWEFEGASCTGQRVMNCTTTVWHLTGGKWVATTAPTWVHGMASVKGRAWVTGTNAITGISGRAGLYQWTGTRWSFVRGPYARVSVDAALVGSPRGELWVQRLTPDGRAIIYHRARGRWNHFSFPSTVSGLPLVPNSLVTFDGHQGFWSGGDAHWDGRRWINALRVALPPSPPYGMSGPVAPIPKTLSTWGLGFVSHCRGRCDRDFIAVFGARP